MRRRSVLTGGGALLGVAAVGGVAALARPQPAGTASTAPAAVATTATATVSRSTLRATVRVEGTLGYLDPRALLGGRAGTVTAAPQAGRTYRRGESLYAVDLRPVPLLYGSVPLFRALTPGVRGADVRQLERNLAALGYADGLALTVDDRYTATTAEAVRRWQHALGVERTGTVAPGDAVVATSPVRVASASVAVGQQVTPGSAVAQVTSTTRGVGIDLDAGKASYAVLGAPVTVTLPTGEAVHGTVTRIGSTAQADGGSGGSGGGGGSGGSGGGASSATVHVEVRLAAGDRAVRRFESAPVDVDLVAEQRAGVLSVPVEALLATPGGGYAVTVVDGAGRRQVAVRTGLFAQGRVEVTGAVRAGDRVEVPTL